MRNAMHSYIYFCSLKYFCMSKKVRKCTRRSEGKEKSICVRLNKISREWCLMVFFTFENVLSKWRQINNPSITTVLSRKQTMAVNRITFQKWTWCNILGIFNIFFFFPCALSEGLGLYSILMCLQKKYTCEISPICLVQQTGPCFIFNAYFFLVFLSVSINTGSLYVSALECLSQHISYWHSHYFQSS